MSAERTEFDLRLVPPTPRGRRSVALRISVLVCAFAFGATRPSAAAEVDEVNAAVRKGVEFLYATQLPAGDWEAAPQRNRQAGHHEVAGAQWGGLTAMATYALLAAGESSLDPRIDKAVRFLLDNEADIVGTYAVALRGQVWLLLPDNHPERKRIRAAVKRDRDLLTASMYDDPRQPSYGFYTYYYDPADRTAKPQGHYDRSTGQYAVLGMWALERAGAEVPARYWQVQDQVWRRAQNADGGWEYKDEGPTTPNMAVAGLATLFITHEHLADASGQCKGNAPNPNIERGLSWMDKNAARMIEEGNLYGTYGVERIGVASGRKFFGATDWYAAGAEWLVRRQSADGSWMPEDGTHNPRRVPNTCFALYFLTRGRAPVVMNKLEWRSVTREGKESGWNQRPRDAAGFTRWMERNLNRHWLNWQVVGLGSDVNDLHDAPILYLAGSEAFAFTAAEEAKLKAYIESGGLLLANADCGREAFARSVRTLGKKLFPRYDVRELEPGHLIFTAEQFRADRWKRKPQVLGLSNGVRELMLLVGQDDLGRAWNARADRSRPEAFQLGANVYLYASGNPLRPPYKGETHIVSDDDGQPPRTIRVARLQAGENPDPEPGGWRRLDAVMQNANLATLEGYEQLVKPGEGKLQAGAYKLAHLTGTTKFTLDDAARAELKAFAAAGGTIVFDAAGGGAAFADAAEGEIAATFGADAAKELARPLAYDHPLYEQGSGVRVLKFGYRDYARRKGVGGLKSPRLKGVTVNGRLAVFLSREDLSGGLVGQPTDGILGYDPATATAIMRNLLTYAAGGSGRQ